ncbi:non-hydrolyzing UDP-N-acetylglucosamine 2-epimerase [Jannaschia sp. R86511]|uniref:non-hydrolyzing UDP-N-acetylglucosamine 2-epimerase n=1 Tax=Jannaschia sp. R86511 TaxID=3093853 RepID=UPI0036D2875C
MSAAASEGAAGATTGAGPVMLVYGTRPEAVKMAPLVRALQAADDVDVHVAVTGQHREMLDQVNATFAIRPDSDLDVFAHGQSLAAMSARVLTGMEGLLRRVRPSAVVVQGDTTTSTVAALSAFYEKVPVVHLEAGLRTGDPLNPFPEEMNRRLTARLAALHLAPTEGSRGHLLAEGVPAGDVCVTGNTVIDALHLVLAQERPADVEGLLGELDADGRRVVLVTTHRRESWGAPLLRITEAVQRLVARGDVQVVLPMHRNPQVRDVLVERLGDLDGVRLTDTVEYAGFCHLMRHSHLVLTDSGGVQEEAPSLGKPVLVMRDNTERPEAVSAGTAALVGTDVDRIVTEATTLLDDAGAYDRMAQAVNPYGDGRAADRATAAVRHLLGLGARLPDFAPGAG